ncbi:hypothetical protein QFC24_001812 [Naganishia onofrii]|uniref:Uncharacterized protein n=1 Tax=Naganishia onofrii TaxID=1851511 RepID=A0ACC2XTT9_9TREE|nr:hypothetical protein QFC24_001812 [Naganishia onofrii]
MKFSLTPSASMAGLLLALGYITPAVAQTFQRLGTCPQLGCIFPPTEAEFIAGGHFDIRLEVHAPVNGSEAYNNGVPDENFKLTLDNGKGYSADVTSFFQIEDSPIEKWNFTYFEDLFARDAKTPTVVNVASKAYRNLTLYEPGQYQLKLSYYNTQQTLANWTVHEPAKKRCAKNVILFIGDGMPQSAITAARLIGHKQVNGKYKSTMQLDNMDHVGLQMTHSIDSFITDSANSATALYTGHKSTVNAISVYADSSPNPFDDPRVETIAELFQNQIGGPVGIVSTAFVADATPITLATHTRDRDLYAPLINQMLNGQTNFSWVDWKGPDVFFGGGAEQFKPGSGSPNKTNYYNAFADQGYQIVNDNTALQAADASKRTLGIFSTSNMAKWLDRHVYTDNLKNGTVSPLVNNTGPTYDQPGLAQMTLKAIDILKARDTENKGFFMMSEAASIDKMFHVLDYERALGELLELDDTVRQTIEHLEKIGELDETLIIVTADHGHGFDVFGSSDTKYLKVATTDRIKREAIGTYQNSGHSEYQVAPGSRPENQTVVTGPQGPNFPVQWDPRYALAAGFAAHPDVRETYSVDTRGPRVPATNSTPARNDYIASPSDQPQGFVINGTIPVSNSQGVHSLTDIPVYTKGPGADKFGGVYDSTQIFFKMVEVLGLGTTKRGGK